MIGFIIATSSKSRYYNFFPKETKVAIYFIRLIRISSGIRITLYTWAKIRSASKESSRRGIWENKW